MHKKYVEEIIKSGNKESMEALMHVFDKAMEHLCECDYEMYEKLEMKLYEAIYGKKVSEDIAIKWVSSMRPVGEYWTMEETSEVIKKYDINVDKVDWYVVLNMIRNDYSKLVAENIELAINLAKNWLDDEDAKKDKLYEYYKYVVKRN